MKILHIIDDLTMGGGQNLLIGLVGMQIQDGNDVDVLQLKKSQDPTVSKKILQVGGRVSSIIESGSLYNPLLIFKLIPRMREYDVIHVHLFPALYWAGLANLVTGLKKNLFYTEHSTKNKRRGNPVLRITDKFIYKHCYKEIVACADKALETFQMAFPSIKNVCAINNGVNTKKYSEAIPYTKKELLGIGEDSFVVTMVARFMPMKRQDTIVEAISKLPKKFHACFVGSEATDEGLIKVKGIADSLGVSDRVHFLYIRPDVDRILKTSDVVVMSSEYEGLSLSSIEGMAAKKPFIATNVDGLREVVSGAGILFELYSSDELANTLLKLESDSNYYTDISNRCEQRAKQYDIKKMSDKYMSVYKKNGVYE